MRSEANFIWERSIPCDESRWLSATEADRERFVGQFAFSGTDRQGREVLARDRLGVNKLFYYLDGDSVCWSNFLIDLLRDGVEPGRIWSVPSGHAVYIGRSESDFELSKHAALPFGQQDGDADVTVLARSIRRALEHTFQMIAEAVGSRPVIVTMSGGLDSTTIAVLAREYLPNVTGVTFSLDDADRSGDSEDATYAMRVADDLRIPVRTIRRTAASLMELLDDTLIYGQDYRDFNVHCGLVNAAIARELSTEGSGQSDAKPVILTGDTMNELMADYSEIELDGRVYYSLPRMTKGRLRRFLINGLDSGDREVGIFTAYGFDVIQPYALCAEVYSALPGNLLSAEDSKQKLVEQVMGERIPGYILKRPKVRAQAGDAAAGQGVLAAFNRARIGQDELKARFAELMGIRPEEASELIKAGFYRFADRHPGGTQ